MYTTPAMHSLALAILTSLAASASLPRSSSAPAAPSTSFTGIGQLRTLWDAGDHADLGCLTDAGLWTANSTLCGIFTATPLSGSSVPTFTLASETGPCRVVGGQFTCGPGNQACSFGIWPWPNAVPGVECLRYGEFGLMASWGSNPPAPADPPEEIHMVTDSETGKYVWVAWAGLE